MGSETLMKEYLLGQLAPEDCVRTEQRLMLDKSFLEQALIVENDLIDAYLEGSLPDKDAFCKHFLSTRYGRSKVRMVLALRKCLSVEATARVSKHFTEKTPPLWKRVLAWGSA